ncbi:THAP-type domain-containing protein [Trichonephila clavipes]|nr:THAP-type domain-containing protein [Trichonephila clavipes]
MPDRIRFERPGILPTRNAGPDFIPAFDQVSKRGFSAPKTGYKAQRIRLLSLHVVQSDTAVCELHFSDDAIRRYTEAYNEKTGEKICGPLKRYRLHDFAVPTIFTDFPTCLSNSGNPTRECPEKRLQRLENEHLQRSIQASIISKEELEKKKSFTSFPELVECLNAEKLQDIWTVICKNDLVIIVMLDTKISPVIKASVIINKDLDLTIHIGQTKINLVSTNFL